MFAVMGRLPHSRSPKRRDSWWGLVGEVLADLQNMTSTTHIIHRAGLELDLRTNCGKQNRHRLHRICQGRVEFCVFRLSCSNKLSVSPYKQHNRATRRLSSKKRGDTFSQTTQNGTSSGGQNRAIVYGHTMDGCLIIVIVICSFQTRAVWTEEQQQQPFVGQKTKAQYCVLSLCRPPFLCECL